eukprot:255518_1
MPKTIQNCKLKAWGSKSLFNLSYMGATHSKAATTAISTNPLKCHVSINSELFRHAIFIHIENAAREQNIHLPSDIITLCMKHISLIMPNTILTGKEEMDLCEHLKSKVTLKHSMKLMYCQLLYEHKFIVKFDMKAFVKTVENKSNILIIFCTQFNHITSLFINQRIHETINVNCKMFALLSRSQFASQCPKELLFTTSHFHWDIRRDVSPEITLGAFGLYEHKMSMYSRDITNIDGNEVFGGKVHIEGRQYCDVQLKQIQIYQLFC